MMNSVIRMRMKPETKLDSFSTPETPIGPLMIMLPVSSSVNFCSRMLKCRPDASLPMYRTLMIFLMISPKASVTIAR